MRDHRAGAEAIDPVPRLVGAVQRKDVEAVAHRYVANACWRICEVDLVMQERDLPGALAAPPPGTKLVVKRRAKAPRLVLRSQRFREATVLHDAQAAVGVVGVAAEC